MSDAKVYEPQIRARQALLAASVECEGRLRLELEGVGAAGPPQDEDAAGEKEQVALLSLTCTLFMRNLLSP